MDGERSTLIEDRTYSRKVCWAMGASAENGNTRTFRLRFLGAFPQNISPCRGPSELTSYASIWRNPSGNGAPLLNSLLRSPWHGCCFIWGMMQKFSLISILLVTLCAADESSLQEKLKNRNTSEMIIREKSLCFRSAPVRIVSVREREVSREAEMRDVRMDGLRDDHGLKTGRNVPSRARTPENR